MYVKKLLYVNVLFQKCINIKSKTDFMYNMFQVDRTALEVIHFCVKCSDCFKKSSFEIKLYKMFSIDISLYLCFSIFKHYILYFSANLKYISFMFF